LEILDDLKEVIDWRKIVAVGLLCLLVGGIAYGAYWIYSNWVTVTVDVYELTLTPESQYVTRYHYANFTARLLKNGQPVKDAVIILFKGNVVVDQAVTDSDGCCVLRYNVTEPEGSSMQFRAGYQVP